MSVSCPICGAEELTKSIKERIIPIELGRDITINETIYSCAECGMEGDFFNENDRKVEAALEESKKQTAVMIIDELSEQDISMAYFERAMGLSTRTLNRWKRGEVSAPSFALMKTVRAYPWILEVADARFEHKFAMDKMIEAAAAEMSTRLERTMRVNNLSVHGSIVGDIDSLVMTLNLKKDIPNTVKHYSMTEVAVK